MLQALRQEAQEEAATERKARSRAEKQALAERTSKPANLKAMRADLFDRVQRSSAVSRPALLLLVLAASVCVACFSLILTVFCSLRVSPLSLAHCVSHHCVSLCVSHYTVCLTTACLTVCLTAVYHTTVYHCVSLL